MRRTIIALAVATALVVGAIVVSANAAESSTATRLDARAVLVDATGTTVGKAVFDLKRDRTTVRVTASGLTPGFHGFHVHTTGVCDASSGFATAGGHWNPGGANHAGHAGDMPSLLVNADGTAEATFETDRFSPAQLLDADGSAVIVHAGADNFANIPTRYHSHVPDASTTFGPDATTLGTGDAGARAACGLVRRR